MYHITELLLRDTTQISTKQQAFSGLTAFMTLIGPKNLAAIRIKVCVFGYFCFFQVQRNVAFRLWQCWIGLCSMTF
jgi:hypothetical protein